MATKTRRTDGTGTLEAAMAILIQNQAQLAGQAIQHQKNVEEIVRRLTRVEQLLANMPEAIREKIGFKQ